MKTTREEHNREVARREAARRRIIPANRLENEGARVLLTLMSLSRHTFL